MTERGLYIVIDGPQGVGKTLQAELLAEYLRKQGRLVRLAREPDSQTDLTARALRRITQDPRYPITTKTEVLLYNAARNQSLDIVRQTTNAGIDCIIDRSFLTTFAVQFHGRADVNDYEAIDQIVGFTVGDMYPDMLVVLDAPVDVLIARASSRGQGERFDSLGQTVMERIRQGYLTEAAKRAIPVIDANRPPAEIHAELIAHVNYARSVVAKNNGARISYRVEEPAAPMVNPQTTQPAKNFTVDKSSNTVVKTPTAEEKLASWVTNQKGGVYAITNELDNLTAAAAMARLSRSSNDLRDTLLLEFSGDESKDEAVVRRIITQYGDDSVQQLLGMHMVVENASNLLTKQLEWGRLAAYLEQSTRYIYYDRKINDKYRYYRPNNIGEKVLKAYETILDKIFDNYSQVVRGLTEKLQAADSTPETERDGAWKSAIRAQACDAARGMLPVAVQSTVGIFASGQALEMLIMRLRASESVEARRTGNRLLQEARKIVPAFFERADQPERGGAYSNYLLSNRENMQKLADQILPSNGIAAPKFGAKLTEFYPRNEQDILPHMLYEVSDRSEDELKQIVANLPYEEKLKIFNSYIGERLNRRHKPGRALERASYSWDIVCDYGIFRDLQRHRLVSDLAWQELTPRYGYDIPQLIEDHDFTELYQQAFDLSLELHSLMQAAGFPYESQYAVLLGHNMRWKVTMNAREAYHFLELRTTPQGHPGYRKLAKQMFDELAEVHPMIASGMTFINQDEDPKLTRLAAERYTQSKLAALDTSKKRKRR